MSSGDGRVGDVRTPHAKWGGRWLGELRSAVEEGRVKEGKRWVKIAEYAGTTGYQVARSLNLGAALPAPPDGKAFEFGAREYDDGTSTVVVRLVDG
jgi:hypothetical protein